MAELHESILLRFRKGLHSQGFKEEKSPMPTFRPDYFGRLRKKGRVVEEVVVEAEIEATLFKDHTAEQLLLMDQYIRHEKRKKKIVRGYLLVPRKNNTKIIAYQLLQSLFPSGTLIQPKFSNS